MEETNKNNKAKKDEPATERININVTPTFKKRWVDYCKQEGRTQRAQLIIILNDILEEYEGSA